MSLGHLSFTIDGVSWWLLLLVVFAAPLIDSIVPLLPGEVVVAAATSVADVPLPIAAVVVVAAAGSTPAKAGLQKVLDLEGDED